MGRPGACADNAAMESFFALLQRNVLDRQRWTTRDELRLAIVNWIERTYHRRERPLRRLQRPPVLPSQCKPWLDGNRIGLLFRFPYRFCLTIGTGLDGHFLAEISNRLGSGYGDVISPFSARHFGLATNYLFRTDQGVGLLVAELPDGLPRGLRPARGVVETWWYPKPLFLVFERPRPGETFRLDYGDPLCVLIPVLCEPTEASEMHEQDLGTVEEERRMYEDYERNHPALRWTSLEGYPFSHTYKAFSSRVRAKDRPH